MIYWIALAVLAAAAILAALATVSYLDGGLGMGIFLLIVYSAVAFGILNLAVVLPASYQESTDSYTKTYSLQALDTGSTVTGRFYLGYGTINGSRTLNYITKDSKGGYHIEQADAEWSTVYEKSDSTRVKVSTYSNYRWWLAPMRFTDFAKTYTFYVPANSILQNYSITNK
jgi:hypothetical protein